MQGVVAGGVQRETRGSEPAAEGEEEGLAWRALIARPLADSGCCRYSCPLLGGPLLFATVLFVPLRKTPIPRLWEQCLGPSFGP